jgi:ABC-type uncharacterized transport system permease subunit
VDSLALIGLLWAILRIAVPYVMATLGGTVCERAGVINIALEGILLLSALGTALGAPYGVTAALASGIAAGVATALLYGLLVVVFRGDQIVCGVAIFMLADGLSRFLLKVVFGSTSNSPRLDALAGQGPLWLLGLAGLATLLVHGMLKYSVLGLRLRAVGDKPEAAQALSVSVLQVRLWADRAVGAAGVPGRHLLGVRAAPVCRPDVRRSRLSGAGGDDLWWLAAAVGSRCRAAVCRR